MAVISGERRGLATFFPAQLKKQRHWAPAFAGATNHRVHALCLQSTHAQVNQPVPDFHL